MAQSQSKPVKVFRYRGVSASVFENHTKTNDRETTFFKVSVQRTYKEGDEWKTTTSFSRDDLPLASFVMNQAWQFILEAEAKRASAED